MKVMLRAGIAAQIVPGLSAAGLAVVGLAAVGLALAGCADKASPDNAVTGPLLVESAWYRPPVPGREMTAAYATLHNASEQAVVLAAFDSPQSRAVELHNHIHEQGVMKMRRVDNYRLEAGATLVMQPGAHHLMLFGFNAGEGAADEIELGVQLASGERIAFSASASASASD